MKATLVFHKKEVLDSGALLELVIWRLPRPEAERPHGLKYRLYYGRAGERLVCYDNERGKGDHKHVLGEEHPYRFVSVDRLIKDFLADVRRVGG